MALTDILSNPGEPGNSSVAGRGNIGVISSVATNDPNSMRLSLIMPPPNSIIRGTVYGYQGETTSTARRPSRNVGM